MFNEQSSNKISLNIPDSTKRVEVSTATLWIDEYGILCAVIKPIRRTLGNQKEMVDAFINLIKGKGKVCFLIDMTNSMPVRNEIREYLTIELAKYVKAHAVVSALPLEKTLATGFQEISKVGYPVNQFTDAGEAKTWLKTFLQTTLKIPDNIKLHETSIGTFWLDEEGILCGISNHAERSIEQYKKNMELFGRLMKNGNKHCFLADGSNQMPVSMEVREYLVAEMPKYIKAQAIVSSMPLPATLSTTFSKLSSEGFPVNQFLTEAEARKWLKTYL